MKMALGENLKRVYGGQQKVPSTRMGNAATLRAALVEAQNYLEKWRHYDEEKTLYDSRVEAGDRPAALPKVPEHDLRLEALGKVLRREIKARVHAHRADDMLTAIHIAEELNLDLTLEHATEGYKIADLLAAKGIPVTAGPILFSRLKYELKEVCPRTPEARPRRTLGWRYRPMRCQRSSTSPSALHWPLGRECLGKRL